jgi:hypothetical protein
VSEFNSFNVLPFLMICMFMLFIIGAVWFPSEAKDMLDPLASLACKLNASFPALASWKVY